MFTSVFMLVGFNEIDTIVGPVVVVGAADIDTIVGSVDGTSDVDDLILTQASASLQSSVSHDRNPSVYVASYISNPPRVMAV